MIIYWRCTMCDPNLYRPNPVEVADDASVADCHKAVLAAHTLVAPQCPAARTGGLVAVDFLVRMVQ